ncbi:MAG: dihydrofolate reductase, partial [Burkholderiales bacterium]
TYASALQIADRILATEIDREYQGDACFPEFEKGHWRETARESREDAASGLRYCFVTLERRA